MASSQPFQANKGNSKQTSHGCLRILLVLVGVALYIGIYSFLGGNYVSHQVVTVYNSTEPLDITVTRGQSLTFEMVYDSDESNYLATPGGIYLTIESVSQPLLVVAPSPEDWGPGSTVTITTHTYKEDTPMLAGTITLPQSIGGPEQRIIQGKLHGTITQPFSKTTIDQSIRLHFVSPGEFLWSGGQLPFDLFAGASLLCALFLLWLQARRLLFAHQAMPPEKRLTPGAYIRLISLPGALLVGLAFLAQMGVAHFLMGVPGNVGSSYPMEISPLTFGILAVLALTLVVYISRLFATGKLANEKHSDSGEDHR